MNVVREDVEKLVEKELAAAKERFGLHHSWHEKYAVTLEELQEAQYEMDACVEWMKAAWESIRYNAEDDARSEFESAYGAAVRLACEAIQVAAMCKKEIDERADNGTAEISDHGTYTGKDNSRVFYCNACRNDFVSGYRPHPHFCPECGAEFTNVLRF